MRLTTLLIATAVVLASCGSKQKNANSAENASAQAIQEMPNDQMNGTYMDLSVDEFMSLYGTKDSAILLDVRTPEEWDGGIIDSAQKMNFFADDFKNQLAGLDKEKPLFVYCASGGRSGKTLTMAQQMGFKEVYNMMGGYSAYSKQK